MTEIIASARHANTDAPAVLRRLRNILSLGSHHVDTFLRYICLY
jgi:hypothetical protein